MADSEQLQTFSESKVVQDLLRKLQDEFSSAPEHAEVPELLKQIITEVFNEEPGLLEYVTSSDTDASQPPQIDRRLLTLLSRKVKADASSGKLGQLATQYLKTKEPEIIESITPAL